MQLPDVSHLPPITSWAQAILLVLLLVLFIRFRRELLRLNGGHGNAKGGGYGFKEAAALSDSIKTAITTLDDRIMREVRDKVTTEIIDTRHSVNGVLATVSLEVREAIDKQTDAINDRLDKIEVAVRESASRRRGYDK